MEPATMTSDGAKIMASPTSNQLYSFWIFSAAADGMPTTPEHLTEIGHITAALEYGDAFRSDVAICRSLIELKQADSDEASSLLSAGLLANPRVAAAMQNGGDYEIVLDWKKQREDYARCLASIAPQIDDAEDIAHLVRLVARLGFTPASVCQDIDALKRAIEQNVAVRDEIGCSDVRSLAFKTYLAKATTKQPQGTGSLEPTDEDLPF